ncbi:hypothetical protein CVS40_9488 [Lucilia cuprina]|nr:hypothetical protein CVS40_9488 [Lucilia cuprina]
MHSKLIVATAVVLLGLVDYSLANKAKTCYSCEGINCMRTSVATTKTCSDPLDYCVTIFDKFNVIQKGCSYEVPEYLRQRCDANTVECHKCNSDRCNNLGQVQFACIQCDSSKDSNCASSASQLTAQRCGSPTAPNSYCYVKYENGSTKRGCSTTVADQLACYSDANCSLCLAGDISGCNSVDFTPGTRANRL